MPARHRRRASRCPFPFYERHEAFYTWVAKKGALSQRYFDEDFTDVLVEVLDEENEHRHRREIIKGAVYLEQCGYSQVEIAMYEGVSQPVISERLETTAGG